MATIFGFGDSILFGSWDDELGGWIQRLRIHIMKKRLHENAPLTRVYNLGVPGETSTQLLQRAEHDLVGRITSSSNFFIVATGMNDLAYILSEQKHVTDLEQFEKNLQSIIRILGKYDNSKVIFLTVTPVNEKIASSREGKNTSRIDAYVQSYNQKLSEVCSRENIAVINVYGALMETDLKKTIASDGVHPTTLGHKIIFTTVLDYLETEKLL